MTAEQIWNSEFIRFLSFRSAFGPMQFLISLVILVILIGNIRVFGEQFGIPITHPAIMIIASYCGLALQSARLKDARIYRVLIIVNLLMPFLIGAVTTTDLTWNYYEPASLLNMAKASLSHIIYWLWLLAYLLLLFFAPSKLQSDKKTAP
ncbi:hypothetical protein WJT86_00820 [Microvirga sp. W0021]|uniref:Uncharacterized protein n=1 Tax=Hohaiivirga grylli TaxID=3133970 RepID=A0ABV0BF35_9HYPH